MLILSIILGILQIIGGFCMIFTPLSTFLASGYFIIILFYIYGLFGVIRAVHKKRYQRDFVFSVLSLILGFVGMVVPGAAVMQNFIILYMIAGWLLVRSVLSFVNAYNFWKLKVAGTTPIVLSVLLGILDLICAFISIKNPAALAAVIGIAIGIFFIESGINTIVVGSAIAKAEDEIFR